MIKPSRRRRAERRTCPMSRSIGRAQPDWTGHGRLDDLRLPHGVRVVTRQPLKGTEHWWPADSEPAQADRESVLAHGAAGAVGTMVTQLAREAGAYVMAPGAPPTARRRWSSAPRSSSIWRTTPWKRSAASTWSSTSSAETSSRVREPDPARRGPGERRRAARGAACERPSVDFVSNPIAPTD
jgi:hypothetical protein